MKDFYAQPATPARFTMDQSAEAPIFLAAEQILVPITPRNVKKEQNAVIRLATSIKKYGILEPLCVRVSPQKDGFPLYELIDGERRFRAAALVGIGKLPCLILPSNDKKCLKISEINELRREKLHFFALSEAFLHLMEKYQMTQDEIAERMGLSQSAVANKLRLLRLSPEERRLIVSGGLTERHARTFLRISDPLRRTEAISIAAREGLNVAETEALVAQILGKNGPENHIFSQNLPENSKKQEILGQNNPFEGKLDHETFAAAPSQITPQPHTTRNGGITPRKFALRDLKPLYNSIERTLSIFEKTGVCAEYSRQEDEKFAHIVIRIPKQ